MANEAFPPNPFAPAPATERMPGRGVLPARRVASTQARAGAVRSPQIRAGALRSRQLRG